jgi:hypothetical protein
LGSLRALLELLKAAREMKAARETRKEGKKSSTKPEKDFDIKERWASELASAGLTSERARAIADKFYEEFSAIVKS